MSNFKEKAKEKYETAKAYVKEHKDDIIIGAGTGVCMLGAMLFGYGKGFKYGSDYGIIKGCEAQKAYDKAVIDNALEMNKYINNYDNKEDK